MNEIKITRNWRFESYIGWSQTWWNYYTQYREATYILLEKVNNNYPIDTMAMPIIFLMRHSLELGLKANIIELEKFSSAKPKLKLDAKSHQIEHLYEYFIAHLNEIIKDYKITDAKIIKDINTFENKLKTLKDIMHSLDKQSYRFRYPVDINKKQNFNYTNKFNIADCVELLQEIDPFLMYLTNVLSEFGVIDPNNFIIE